MHRRTAAFLAGYAERGQDSRVRFPLAGIAARTLAAAVRRGDREAAEAVWRAWLRHPGDQPWSLLCEYRGARAMAEAAFAAATDPALPAAARAALGAFCARRGLVPAAGPGRVLFYLLSGQSAQQHATDPDGAALAAAYRAADEPHRTAMREAMAGDGDLDLIRVVAAHGAEPAAGGSAVPGSATERDYLAAELARRRDWPRLWRLALDLPLAEAVAAAQRLPADWQPDGAAATLRARLAAVSPAAITALATAETITHLDLRDPGYALHGLGPYYARYNRRVLDCEFAPDGSRVALFSDHWEGTSHRDHQANLCALPGGGQLELIPGTRSLLFLGRAVVYVTEPPGGHGARVFRQVRGHAVEDLGLAGQRPATEPWLAPGPWLVPVPDGFVLVARDRLRHGTDTPGSPLRDVTPASIREHAPHGVLHYRIRYAAAEPRTGRLAVVVSGGGFGKQEVLLLSPDGETTGRIKGAGSTIGQLAFCGPDRLITLQANRQVSSWRVTAPAAAEAVVDARSGPYVGHPRIYSLPAAGLVLAGPDCLDAATLQPAAWPPALDWMRDRDGRPWKISPDGGNAVVAGDWDILEIRDRWQQEAGELLRKPMARLRPAALAAVIRLTDGFPARQAAAPGALGLLRACLEHRFGAEVALGAGPTAGTADDIAIAARRAGRQ